MESGKRKHSRIAIDEPVGVHSGDHYRVERGRDFSDGGMKFESGRSFADGQLIKLTFKLSDAILIEVDGRVAYVAKPATGKQLVGVEFVFTGDRHVKILADYFKNRGS